MADGASLGDVSDLVLTEAWIGAVYAALAFGLFSSSNWKAAAEPRWRRSNGSSRHGLVSETKTWPD